MIAIPAGLVAARRWGMAAAREIGPDGRGWRDGLLDRPWRTNAGSFHCYGYFGTIEDRVVQALTECTRDGVTPRLIVCGAPVFASFRSALFRTPMLEGVTAEEWFRELHGAAEFEVMGARVNWSHELQADEMWFFDRLTPRMAPRPRIENGRLVGGPPGLLGVITGWLP